MAWGAVSEKSNKQNHVGEREIMQTHNGKTVALFLEIRAAAGQKKIFSFPVAWWMNESAPGLDSEWHTFPVG